MKKMKLNIQFFSIPHTYIEFEDFPSTNTPLTAANLNQMQSDIYDDIRENGGGSGETLKVGTILQYSGTTVPTGYMFCDGTAISRTEYATLFEVIGTTYGSGDGSTTFNLPNFNGRVPVGLDNNDSDFDNLGETGGEKTHTLTINEMPSHSHSTAYISSYSGGNQNARTGYGYNEVELNRSSYGNSVAKTGGGQAHNILQPYIVTKFIIKVSDTTPVSAQIVDSYSASTTDGYSANYVNGLNTYSTTEHRIGTWINGKPLYRKVIDIGNLPNTNDKKIDTGLIFNSNNCILRNFYGVASYSNGISFPLPYINPIDITYTVSLNLNSNNQVVVTTGSDRSLMTGYVVLEYTKTTD